MHKRTALAKSLLIAFGSTAVFYSSVADAQPASELERVTVTGSSIKRTDAETAVPVTILRVDDLKKQGLTTVEQVMSQISASQTLTSTSQVVGAGTGGASFANLRGVGQNKTLVLLDGRRLANNAIDSSAPDLNLIPFAALDRIEILRDGASSLYGTDAIGGVINFITKREFTGGSMTLGADKPQHPGGRAYNGNIGFGKGDLTADGYNVYGFFDYQKTNEIGGKDRNYNTRYAGGLSPTTSPANYFQAGNSGNPAAPDCTSAPNLIPSAANKNGTRTGCQITTSSFVNYTPDVERYSGLLKGAFRLPANNQLGVEYFLSQDRVDSVIAPVPYGGLFMNRVRPDGTLNPYYPGNTSTSIVPNIPLDPNYFPAGSAARLGGTLKPGYINVKWRDLPNGSREGITYNTQQRLVATLDGMVSGWDYQAAAAYNENKIKDKLAGYSNGPVITAGVRDGVINPFGDQSAAGSALLSGAGLAGTLQNAKGQVYSVDGRVSRELGDWLKAGRAAALAIGAEARHEKFSQQANYDFASLVSASTGFDPNTSTTGSRSVYAAYAEFNLPLLKTLDVTAAVRYDKYSDFGSTTNPKVSFRFQPVQQILMRGSYSTGFRAPSLYEINAAQTYTNTSQFDDPVNCPNGTPIPGKSAAANCQQQFQALNGGNMTLKPEKARNATLGFVLEPFNDFNLGFDFWWIRIKQSIGSLADTTVFGDPGSFGYVFHRNPAGDLATDGSQCPDPATCGYVDLRTQNLGKINTNGVDLSANYRLRGGSAGDFRFAIESTYVQKYEYQDYADGPYNQNVGVYSGVGPIFRWQHNVGVTWSLGGYAAGVTMRSKTGYLDQDGENHVASYTLFDIYGAWAPIKPLTLTVGVRNLFDRDPPLSYQTQVFQAGYDPRFTNPTGRAFYGRATYTF